MEAVAYGGVRTVLTALGYQRRSGGPSDGAVSRRQIARVLVAALSSDAADRKPIELIAERGPEPRDLDPYFAALDTDAPGKSDGVRDGDDLPLDEDPTESVRT
jgi:hypothetical protein